MSDLYERQLALEETYSTDSIIRSQKQVLDAFAQGRASDMGSGRILIAKAFEAALPPYIERINAKDRGLSGKYLKLLRDLDPEVVVMAALRVVINDCAAPTVSVMQAVMRQIGKSIESESMIAAIMKLSPAYGNKTIQYLDSAGTTSVSHRYRTLLAGANNIGLGWEAWHQEERIGVAKVVLNVLYEHTGLFKWVQHVNDMYIIRPTDVLEKYLSEAVDSAKAGILLPPMLVQPTDWGGQFDGGYLTEWCRSLSPMCGVKTHTREQRQWMYKQLSSPEATPVRSAMNKAQGTPYRVNTEVLQVLREAVAMRVGILGLPSTAPAKKPDFPFPEGWLKDDATTQEMDQFNLWKRLMADWYTAEAKRVGRKAGILSKITELAKFKDEARLYFPTFIDWRGRMYFRSTIHPQLNDAVKGCLEFADGKPLGAVGLHWLKVHVANSCGYDKHDDAIKAKWTEDNWELIRDFINNPLDVDAPEPDTAFTLLQAGLALQEALSLTDATKYVCHVPVAMDATCSGLQHLSALTRDEVGGTHTNLVDSITDQKADIYTQVGSMADTLKNNFTNDVVIQDYWKDKPVSRKMAKPPVMTYVYGSTLLSTMDTIQTDMTEAGLEVIRDDDGNILYSIQSLAVPIAKALRYGVENTVPRCANLMAYLQKITRKYKEQHLQWITPVGVPVVNWSEGRVTKRVWIKSMGVAAILVSYNDGKYNVRKATNGVVPNFVHSLDAAHLCMTINEFGGQVVPIHDSFGTHPCDVPEMHKALRSTFVELYSNYSIEDLLQFNNIDTEEYPVPEQGKLDIQSVHTSRFMFC